MEEGLDTGPIYVTREIDVDPRETGGTLHDKLAALSAEVAVQTLSGLEERVPTPQPTEGITWAPKIAKSDGRVDWNDPAEVLDRRIRAMTPWPGGQAPWGDQTLKLKEAHPVAGEGAPGTLLSTSPLVVACGQGALEIVTAQAPGRRAVSGRDFANGLRLAPGDRLWPS